MILAREGIDIEFQNGNNIWTPFFEYNTDFKQECLHIGVEEASSESEGVEIIIKGLHSSQVKKITENTLFLQEGYSKYETSYGDVLKDDVHSGKIYVGGLFVCNFKSKYGFNFNPEDFPLDRDRRSLQPFDIEWQTKSMWVN